MKQIYRILSVAAAICAVGLVPFTTQAAPKKHETIAALVAGNPNFSILYAAVLAADPIVANRLSSNGQNTVFAPTDEAFLMAFDELGVTPEQVLANTELLTLILNYHISPGFRESKNVVKSKKIRMRAGGFLQQSAGTLTDNVGRTANIIEVDLKASNGVIHVIDRVVLPALP